MKRSVGIGNKVKRLIIVAVFVLIIMFVIIVVRTELKAKSWSEGHSCNNNLRMLDSAKEQAALNLGLKAGDTIPEKEVLKYVKDGVMPECPSGGKYIIDIMGKNPKCTLRPVNKEDSRHQLPIGD